MKHNFKNIRFIIFQKWIENWCDIYVIFALSKICENMLIFLLKFKNSSFYSVSGGYIRKLNHMWNVWILGSNHDIKCTYKYNKTRTFKIKNSTSWTQLGWAQLDPIPISQILLIRVEMGRAKYCSTRGINNQGAFDHIWSEEQQISLMWVNQFHILNI